MGEDSLKVVEGLESAMNARDWAAWDELHAENVVLHSPDSPEPTKGRENVRAWYKGFTDGFPDLDVTQLRLFASGEWVVGEYTVKGTHTGPLPGPEGEIAPTNKVVTMPSATVYRVAGGQIQEIHEYFDQMGFMAQLGLLEGP
ncbi:MAG: ester cyclase [Thermoplasmata archaeon]|nr:ester cyclase [Thermoplasmata archaeon]